MTRTTARRTTLAAALISVGLAVPACAGGTDDGHGSAAHGTPTSTSTTAPASGEDANDADVQFAAGMVPHHEDALRMSALADDRAADPRVRELAARIEAAQGPEIETLTGWLQEWGADPTDGSAHRGMDHGGGMEGMDTDALTAATGAEFDRLFLIAMIEHHRGAVAMAETELAAGRNDDAVALAESIRDSQAAEIAEMEQLLGELGG